MIYRVPLTFTPQPEGGYTVTSAVLPELVTEGDTLTEAQENACDALAAVVELYADLGRAWPIESLENHWDSEECVCCSPKTT